MKRTVKGILAGAMAVLMLSAQCLAYDVTYNAAPIEFDVPPQAINGRVLVPLRAIFETLGATVDWNQGTQTVTATRGDTEIQLTLGQATANLNGNPVELDVPAQAIDGRTLVPVRFISESMNASVQWDSTTGTVRICDRLYIVTRVVDGDTFIVDFDGVSERVRLIGIDTPESVHPDKSKNTDAGITASEYTRSLIEGKQVELEFDVQERDMYGRLLAYVYVDGVMLNKTLLREGYAALSTWPPNVKYVDDFRKIVVETPSAQPMSKKELIQALKENPSEEALASGYVITETGEKYHVPSCRTVKDSAIPITLEMAKELGYEPCGICIKR